MSRASRCLVLVALTVLGAGRLDALQHECKLGGVDLEVLGSGIDFASDAEIARLEPELRLDERGQTIEAFACIDRLRRDIDPLAISPVTGGRAQRGVFP